MLLGCSAPKRPREAKIQELTDALRYNRGLTDFSQSAEPLAVRARREPGRAAGARGAGGDR